MSKYNHSPKVRQVRNWYLNVGDGAKKSIEKENPNDSMLPRKRILSPKVKEMRGK